MNARITTSTMCSGTSGRFSQRAWVDAVGYDDDKTIGGQKGALLIQNSWGADWGEGSYGWMPCAYFEAGLADDFWSLVKSDYIDTELFR